MITLTDTSCSSVRGFNYQPGYARNGLDSWVDRFDAKVIEHELGLGKKYFPGINTIRTWLSFDAFLDSPEKMASNFDTVLRIGEDLELQFIPVLYNAWRSFPDFGGITIEQINFGNKLGVFESYLETIVGNHKDDDRILIWDMCNEPFNGCDSQKGRDIYKDWLQNTYRTCKKLGAYAPVAVGACPSVMDLVFLDTISDVLTFHPYYAYTDWVPDVESFAAFLDESVDFANSRNKPLLATETCWGSLDDAKRVETIQIELGELSKRGVGFTAHLLCHSSVADAHRRWLGEYKGAGFMGFIEADGSLRPGHDIYNNY